MVRFEIATIGMKTDDTGLVEHILKRRLHNVELPLHLDDKLLFYEHNFNYSEFATYDNGHKKEATIRFKDGVIRIPKYNILPAYETNEYNEGLLPRAFVMIDKVIIATPNDFTKDELAKDGFKSARQMIKDMRHYYPTISSNSLVSLYSFAHALFNLEPEATLHYCNDRNIPLPGCLQPIRKTR